MQTAGGGLQVIRSVEFQERGEAGKHLHIAHLVTPSMLLSFFVVSVIWLCVGEKGRNEKSSSFGGKRRWVHILGNCFSNAASWIYYDAGDDCQSSSKPSLPDSVVLWWFEEKGGHLVFQTDRNSGEVIRWLGNFSIWPFQTLALSGKDWSDQETFDLNSTSHYRLPGNIFAVLFK